MGGVVGHARRQRLDQRERAPRDPIDARGAEQRPREVRGDGAARAPPPARPRDELEDAPRRQRLRVHQMERPPARSRVAADRDRGPRHPIHRHEVERLVAAAGQRERQVGRRRDDQQEEQVRAVEAVDLARPRVAHDRRRPHHGDRHPAHRFPRELLRPRPRLLDDAPERLSRLELVLLDHAAPVSRDARRRVHHQALEPLAAARELDRLARPADVHALRRLPLRVEVRDLGAVVDARHLAPELLVLGAREAEVDGRRVPLEQRDAGALLGPERVEVGLGLLHRSRTDESHDARAGVRADELLADRTAQQGRKPGEEDDVVDHGCAWTFRAFARRHKLQRGAVPEASHRRNPMDAHGSVRDFPA